MRNRERWIVILLLLALCVFAMVFHIRYAGNEQETQKYHMLLSERIHDRITEIVDANDALTDKQLAYLLKDRFLRFEKEYGVVVRLVDEDRVPVLDSENIYGDLRRQEGPSADTGKEKAYVKRVRDRFSSSQRIERLGLYLNVESDAFSDSVDNRFFAADFLAFVFVAVLSLFLLKFTENDKKDPDITQTDRDPRTGLHNERYFIRYYGEKGLSKTTRYKSIAVFQIDIPEGAMDLAVASSTVQKVVECAQTMIGERGTLFRFRDNEFMILMEWSVDFAYEICRDFCKKAEAECAVTVSVGLTQIHLFDTIRKNYYRAVQYCYLVKEMGGNGVKRG